MNRDVCEHFNPVDLPCEKCQSASVQKSTLRETAQQALDVLENAYMVNSWAWVDQKKQAVAALKAALAEPVQEPVAWSHNFISDNIISHRPADLKRHPDRWTALFTAPQPCPTCEALARTVMRDQTSHDTAPPQRKPLTEEEIIGIGKEARAVEGPHILPVTFARAIERAHGIGGNT